VPAERVQGQVVETLHNACTDRVEVDVTDKLQKIGIFLAQDRLEPVLEKMAVSAVGPVIPESITGQEAAHNGRDGSGTGSEQEVEVAWNQDPGIAGGPGILEYAAQAFKKVLSIGIDVEYLSLFDASAHDVMKRTRGVYPRSSRHEISIPRSTSIVKLIS